MSRCICSGRDEAAWRDAGGPSEYTCPEHGPQGVVVDVRTEADVDALLDPGSPLAAIAKMLIRQPDETAEPEPEPDSIRIALPPESTRVTRLVSDEWRARAVAAEEALAAARAELADAKLMVRGAQEEAADSRATAADRGADLAIARRELAETRDALATEHLRALEAEEELLAVSVALGVDDPETRARASRAMMVWRAEDLRETAMRVHEAEATSEEHRVALLVLARRVVQVDGDLTVARSVAVGLDAALGDALRSSDDSWANVARHAPGDAHELFDGIEAGHHAVARVVNQARRNVEHVLGAWSRR